MAGCANLGAISALKAAALQFSLICDSGVASMRQFSINDLLSNIKAVTMAADRKPVAVTQNGGLRYVLMSFEDYLAMRRGREDPRRVFGPGETPPELVEMILPELDELIAAQRPR